MLISSVHSSNVIGKLQSAARTSYLALHSFHSTRHFEKAAPRLLLPSKISFSQINAPFLSFKPVHRHKVVGSTSTHSPGFIIPEGDFFAKRICSFFSVNPLTLSMSKLEEGIALLASCYNTAVISIVFVNYNK